MADSNIGISELAGFLFQYVVDFTTEGFYVNFLNECEVKSNLIKDKYFQQVFVYQVAGVAILLTDMFEKLVTKREKQDIGNVIVEFRNLVSQVLIKMANLSQTEVEDIINKAGSDLESLLITDPNKFPDFGMEWSKKWLNQIGINENNPIKLFKFGHFFMSDYFHLAEVLSRFNII